MHAITGLKQTAPSKELFSGAHIRIVGTHTSLSLFEGEEQRFSAVTNETDGFLIDALAIKLTSTEAATLSHYESFGLSTVAVPTHNEPVSAVGFAGLGMELIEPKTLTGHILEIEDISVKLTVPSAPGFSGSALIGENGLIGILHGDVGEYPNLSNALAITFGGIAPQLFG